MMEEIDWTNRTILIAENEYANYIFIEAVLESTKAHLLWAVDGKQAVNMTMENDNIDVVLMDINMPEMDGIEATSIIKQRNVKLPVIAQSAYSHDYERNIEMKKNFDFFLAKPFKPKQLISAIQTYF